jgi:lysophospholipase L1-like esterase
MPFARQTATNRTVSSGRVAASSRGAASGRTAPTVPADVILFGDSITANQGVPAGQTSLSWFASANTTLGGVFSFTRNAGVSGDTTALMLARLTNDVLPYQPSWVGVLGGVNDITADTVSATTIANLTAIYDAILARGARLICEVVLPCTSFSTAGRKAAVDAINAAIRAYASAHRPVVLIDWWAAFSDPNSNQGYDPLALYTSDGKHPSATGAGVMGAVWAAAVASVKPGTVGV